jgi:hypothetical protein
MRRAALAAIGVGFFVLSGTTLGADLRIAEPSAVAAALGGREVTAHPTEPPAIKARTTSAFVDDLYKELMEWTPPPCLSPMSSRPEDNALSPLDGTGGLDAAQRRAASSPRARRYGLPARLETLR